jgi:AraC-like DNA-binding protein
LIFPSEAETELPYSSLRKHSLVETTVPEEMHAALVRNFGVRSFDLPQGPNGFAGRSRHARLQSTSLTYCYYGADTRITFPEVDFVRQQIVLSGQAVATVRGDQFASDERSGCILPADSEATLHYRAGMEQLIFRVDTDAMLVKLTALLGFQPNTAPVFYPSVEYRDPATDKLRRLVLFVASELGDEPDLPQPVLDELEQALVAAFLTCNRHSYSALLDRQSALVAPWQVNLVEQYIEANWTEAITVERLAAVTGASARSIFHSFRRARGYSPMDFVKQVRLRQAKRMLETGAAGTTVTGIALSCRFGNMGHFARDYRALYGELPSDTLNRARGARLNRA